ncbi:membrane protein [Candidatus Methylomirabilis lanthanidiphila]|uniref:lipopolysaccharide heptosyltransferase II n=1 Tax=Candidatus Methylomirabilis lanthanidiphila TaxID=2211376 RepID=A0A564ZI04_9BACT|nr:putative lipopolysaccharide heptosyltransferase III [Candidatus Methylomirabilis lanthanidiphila]VUZ84925.1 membrane protein [Candidatus Methylomirabilis lanthanidiphila]
MRQALGGQPVVWKDRYLAYSEPALQYGLVVLIVLLPSAALRSVKGALLIGLVVVWLVRMLVARDAALRRTPLDAPLAAYIAWIAFTLITAAHVMYSLGELLKLMVSVLVFYLVVNQVRDRQAARRLFSAIVLTTCAVSSFGVLKFFLIQQGSLVDRAVRANSLTPDYHWLSTYLVLTIPILLCLAMVQHDWRSRLLFHATCGLSCIALFLTYTRGAWVALLAELCAYGWAARRRLYVILAGGTIAAGLTGLLLLASQSDTVPFSPNADTLNPYTLMTRIKTSGLAIQEISRHPLMGIGYGGKTMVKVYTDAPEVKEAPHPHNLFVEVALGTGIPGLILLLWIFFAVLKVTWGGVARAADPFGRAALLGLGMAVVGIIVSNLFDHIFAGGMAHLFWVLMALAVAIDAAPEGQTVGIEPPQRILVIKLRYLGDVLLSTPVLASLREAFPKAGLSMLVNPSTEAIIATNPHLDEVLIAERTRSLISQLRFAAALRGRRFDLVVDLTDGDRAAILSRLTGAAVRIGFNREGRWRGRLYTHVVPIQAQPVSMIRQHLMALETLAIPVVNDSLPVLRTRASDDAAACAALGAVGIGPGERFVAVHPGARWWWKSWPADRFASLIDHMQKTLGMKVVLLGSVPDREIAEAILDQVESDCRSLVGRLTLLELAGVLRQATLLVGNDNGPMHIAAAMGTPVIGLFGPADPRIWGPVGQGHAVLYKGIDCRSCFPDGCRRGEQNCMRLIALDEVISVVERMLEEPGLYDSEPALTRTEVV